jgi:hypothetical protein
VTITSPSNPVQRLAGGQHRVPGAERRVLNRDRASAQASGGGLTHRRRVRTGHNHDAFASGPKRRVDGAVEQGPAAHRVQHLGPGALHARALTGGQDDGGSHGGSNRLRARLPWPRV